MQSKWASGRFADIVSLLWIYPGMIGEPGMEIVKYAQIPGRKKVAHATIDGCNPGKDGVK